jgi:hypothetical protein
MFWHLSLVEKEGKEATGIKPKPLEAVHTRSTEKKFLRLGDFV